MKGHVISSCPYNTGFPNQIAAPNAFSTPQYPYIQQQQSLPMYQTPQNIMSMNTMMGGGMPHQMLSPQQYTQPWSSPQQFPVPNQIGAAQGAQQQPSNGAIIPHNQGNGFGAQRPPLL